MYMQYLAINRTGTYRKATLNGKAHYVVPVAMIVPGVLPGSKGKLFYPAEEVAKNPDAWNGMPLVVTHPIVNGKAVSARSATILDSHGVGVVLNSHINKNGKLVAEGWFDVEKTNQVDSRIISKIERGEQIELSTGLFTDNIPVKNVKEAIHNGKQYTHIARNYRPDHLAILLDEQGACSIKDGCGVGVLNAASARKDAGKLRPKSEKCNCGSKSTCKCKPGENLSPEKEPTENELSYSELHTPLEKNLSNRFPGAYLNEVYRDYIIFRYAGNLYQLGYSIDKKTDVVSFDSEMPTVVRKVVTFKPVELPSGVAVTNTEAAKMILNESWFKICPHEDDEPTENSSDPLDGLSNTAKAHLILTNVFSDEARAAALEARRKMGQAAGAVGKAGKAAVVSGVKAAGGAAKAGLKRTGQAYKEVAKSLLEKIKAKLGIKSKPVKMAKDKTATKKADKAKAQTRQQKLREKLKANKEALLKKKADRAAKKATKKSISSKVKKMVKQGKESKRSKQVVAFQTKKAEKKAAVAKASKAKRSADAKSKVAAKKSSSIQEQKLARYQKDGSKTKAGKRLTQADLDASKTRTEALKKKATESKASLAKSKEKLALLKKIEKVNAATREKQRGWDI